MKVLYLTNNPNVCSTSRILQSWLLLGTERDVQGQVVLQRAGDLSAWLAAHRVPFYIDRMPWPNRRWPVTSFWHASRVARWARRAGVEIIHCNEHDIFPFALLLRKLLRIPLICHVRFLVERGFAEWTFAGASRMPDALLWTSYQQKRDCAAAIDDIVPENRQHVVRLGVDLNEFGNLVHLREATRNKYKIAPHEIVVGTASPLRPRKRVGEFVELIARLASESDRVVGLIAGGTIAGDEPYRDKIVQQIAQTGLGRRLQWVGDLTHVEPFYQACDILVSTSEYETFGNSVCEAMACQRPVVGYEGGSVREVVGDTGIIVDTGDLDALTTAARRLIEDSDLRRSLGSLARQRVADVFNPAESLQQLGGIYRSILTKGRGPQ